MSYVIMFYIMYYALCIMLYIRHMLDIMYYLSKYLYRIFFHSVIMFYSRWPDMIIEVAHPDITRRYGELIVQHADYFVFP